MSGINVPRAVQVDTDGSIVVGGFNGDDKFVVVKYHEDSKLNTHFGINGISTIHFNSGGIIDFGLARLTKDGQLDLSFNKTGKQITYFVQPAASSLWALTLQKDGKIIAVGDVALVKSLGMARYNIDGTLDETFGDHGKQIAACPGTCHWEAVTLQADHKIVAGGYVWNGKHYDMAVIRGIMGCAIDVSCRRVARRKTQTFLIHLQISSYGISFGLNYHPGLLAAEAGVDVLVIWLETFKLQFALLNLNNSAVKRQDGDLIK